MRSHRTYRCSAHLSVEDAPVGGGGAPRERLPVGRACGVACRNEKTPGPWAPGVKGGGWGIRTPEGLHPTRFPSVRHRPLGESSRRSTRPAATCNGQRIYPTPPGWRHSAKPRPRWDRSRAPADERERVLPASWSRHRCQCERRRADGSGEAGSGPLVVGVGRRQRARPASRRRRGGASSGMVFPGPSCGVIQRIPQDRKVARVSGLWRVHGGSSHAPRIARGRPRRDAARPVMPSTPTAARRPERCYRRPLEREGRATGHERRRSARHAPVEATAARGPPPGGGAPPAPARPRPPRGGLRLLGVGRAPARGLAPA